MRWGWKRGGGSESESEREREKGGGGREKKRERIKETLGLIQCVRAFSFFGMFYVCFVDANICMRAEQSCVSVCVR